MHGGQRKDGWWKGLPEGTAAVPKGTEPNTSALAGSVWDEDGRKASPGVAGVCETERGRGHVRLGSAVITHGEARQGRGRARVSHSPGHLCGVQAMAGDRDYLGRGKSGTSTAAMRIN